MKDTPCHIHTSWNPIRMLMRGPLTGRKIEQYQKQGYYSEEFRQARRDLIAKKTEKRTAKAKREGNYVLIDGRLVYSPV